MKIALPDRVSNSYFPAIAAVELGLLAEEGVAATHELVYPVDASYRALADGDVDFVAGSAHAALAAFPEWRGAKLICAQAQGMYWFLVMRADLGVARGEVEAVKGRFIGAAPWVDIGLRRLLEEAGIDVERDRVKIAPIPLKVPPGTSFGVTAAKALADGLMDGFWANGMGAEAVVRAGVGTVVLDVRRGDGPPACFNYTQPAMVATDRLIAERPEAAAAMVRAINRAHAALKADIGLAAGIGEKLFPPENAALIADVVTRDLPYYDTVITEEFVDGMNRFARDVGILEGEIAYEQVVATQFRELWTG